jgi:hypothetical protein
MANVDPGSYSIFAKTMLVTAFGETDYTASCTLVAGGSTVDTVQVVLGYLNYNVALGSTHVFASTGSIQVRCQSNYATDARLTKIIATKVDAVSRQAVSG